MYHKKTCIRFQQRANGEAAYVSIENEPSVCGLAHVCRGGGYQFAQFGGSCRNAGVMVHELGHSLCFGHEQSREDRDDFLSFPCGSGGGKDTNFDINLFYDYKSAMHYGCDNCMKPKMTDVSTSMCGGDFSVLDAEKVNAFYDCPGILFMQLYTHFQLIITFLLLKGCLGYRFRSVYKLTAAEKADLLIARDGGELLYVCRAYQNGDIIPGTGNINSGKCYVSIHQLEHVHTNGEFLTKGKAGSRLAWSQKPSNNVIPSNAIAGGRSRLGETLYVARATVSSGGRSSVVVGKVHAGRPDIAFLPFDGKEHEVYSFEFLVCN